MIAILTRLCAQGDREVTFRLGRFWHSCLAKCEFEDLATVTVEERNMWTTLWEELREVAWLTSVITGLSLAGVGLAVALATVSG